ncbi:hypothetical protein CPB86DRAFT_872819 [Serendipita vermifera]|nr:hypothetical protein CPB86DRAFT_872819 [Serendipita vermifera]
MADDPVKPTKEKIYMPTEENPYDLLSFMSLFVANSTGLSSNFLVTGLLLDRMSAHLENPVGRGSSFSVIIAKRDVIRKNLGFSSETNDLFDSHKEVALKRPLIRGKPTTLRNRQILSSMAIEYQVLQIKTLREQANIIQLLGVCWQTVDVNDGLILPVFVLEPAEYGNLVDFIQSNQTVTYEEAFWLLLDMASGLAQLHENGIVHCDVKPENTLVFKGSDRKFKAKISDFGSAVFLANTSGTVRVSNGTQLWQAPECSEPIDPEELHKIDVYSFGCVSFDFLSGNRAMESMRRDFHALPEPLKDADLLRELAYLGLKGQAINHGKGTLKDDAGQDDNGEKEDTDGEVTSRGGALKEAYIGAARLCFESLSKSVEARSSMSQVVQDLRYILHGLLRATLLDIPKPGTSTPLKEWTVEEEDILICPDLGKPTPADVQRIAMSQATRKMVNDVFDKYMSQKDGKKKDEKRTVDVAIENILNRWEKLNHPPEPQPKAQLKRGPSSVVEVYGSHGTMYLLPQPVIEQIVDTLQVVADSVPVTWRQTEASFELAFALLSGLDQREEDRGRKLGLHMLSRAATQGMEDARAIVDSLHAAFGAAIPFDTSNPNRELKWLSRAASTGHPVAQRRLKEIDPLEYDQAMEKLRNIYCGIGVEPQKGDGGLKVSLERVKEWVECGLQDEQEMEGGFRLAATAGDLDLVTLIESTWSKDIDCRDKWGDTALTLACRSGHWNVAQYLMDHGADVTIASNENVTALHWISSFPQEKIQKVTDMLISHGADIEARSYGASDFYGGGIRQWHKQGKRDGTPLLWAVISCNITAVRALLSHGADPWDKDGSTVNTNNDWGNISSYSPVDYASEYQMHEILQLLLREVPDGIKHERSPLNMHCRPFAAGAHRRYIFPLARAVSGPASRPFELILLHGKELKNAIYETIQLLFKKGANPKRVRSDGGSAASMAALGLDITSLEQLYELNGDLFRLDDDEVLSTLRWAISKEKRALFDFLLRHHQDIIYANLQGILENALSWTSNPYFVGSIMADPTSGLDYGRLLWLAVQGGNFRLALAIHKRAPFDPQYAVNGMTTLGDLIRRVKSFGLLVQALEFTFSLFDPYVDDEKNGFWAAFKHDEHSGGSTKVSLLHLAALQNEFISQQTKSTRIFNILLKYYNLPHQINAIVPETLWTALHFAVASGNAAAVKALIEEPDINLSPQDYMGKTPTDILWTRFCGPKESFEFFDIPVTERDSLQESFEETTGDILLLLRGKGAKSNLCCGILRRDSEGEGGIMPIPSDIATQIIFITVKLQDIFPSPQYEGTTLKALANLIPKMQVGETWVIYKSSWGGALAISRTVTSPFRGLTVIQPRIRADI